MATMKFTNNATSSLASGISSSDTSLTVAGGQGSLFPTLSSGDYFYCTLTNSASVVEIVKVTARSSDTLTIVRGQDSTTANSWQYGDKVELRLVAANLNDLPKLDQSNTFTASNTFTSITASNDSSFTSTGALQISKGTTAQQPGTPSSGMLRFNTTTTQFEGYDGTAWGGIGGAQAGGAIQVNKTTASVSYTIPTGSSGMSVGPVNLDSGVTVTVSSGQRWLIL